MKKKVSDFQNMLDQLFDITADNTYEVLKASRRPTWKEDGIFLLNQTSSRTGYMSGVDRELSRQKNRRNFRSRKGKIDNLCAINSGKQYQTTKSNIDEEELQEETEIKMLEDCNIQKNIIALVFDATASNTGLRNGCSVLMKKELGRSLLWLACRHHIYEIHLKNIW